MNAQEMVDSEARYNTMARWFAAGFLVGPLVDDMCTSVAVAALIVVGVTIVGRLRWHWWFASKIASTQQRARAQHEHEQRARAQSGDPS